MEVEKAYESISIVGPTASGKTGRAVSLAKLLNGEIISADSRQVYKDMTLGTGKDLAEYGQIRYHLIDIADPGEKYNLYRFLADFEIVFTDIKCRNKYPVICGGSGLYIETALSGISLPEVSPNLELRAKLETKSLEELSLILASKKNLHNTTDIDTKKRAIRALEIEDFYEKNPDIADKSKKNLNQKRDSLIIGIDISREDRRKRISNRLETRLQEGMVEEVKSLLNKGISADDLIYYGLEYKFITLYITGRLSYLEMKSQLEIAIHQFAKRQMTWFRGMEKRGYKIHWLPYDLSEDSFNIEVIKLLSGSSL